MKLSRILDVRPGERRRVAGMFGLLALIIATSYVLKPVRSALFLSQFGAQNLPYVYLLVALVLGLVAGLFARLSPRADIARLLVKASLLFASNLILFWVLVVLDWRFTGFAFYVWVSLFTALMPSLFWLLANYVFYSNEGRRLFPVVMAGGLLGSVGGGALTSLLVPVVGTSGLLLSAAGILGLVALLARRNVSRERDRISERRSELGRREKTRVAPDYETPLAVLRRSRYLSLLAGLILLTSLVSTLVDYQFSVVVEANFVSRDQMTRFFGTFFAAINVAAFVLQLVGVGRLLGWFGVSGGLILLPGALLLASGSFFAAPALLTAVLVKAADDGLSNSVNRASMEVLYLPVPLNVKNRLKAWLDMFVERASRGLAGLVILALTSWLAMSNTELSVLIIALIVPWIVIIFLLKGAYVSAFRNSVARREVSDFNATMNDPASLSVVRQILSGDDPREIIYALELATGTDEPGVLEQAAKLTTHPDSGVRAAAYRALKGAETPPSTEQLDARIINEAPPVAAEALALYLRTDPEAGQKVLDRLVTAGDVERLQAVLDVLGDNKEPLPAHLLRKMVEEHRESEDASARRLAASAMAFFPDVAEPDELELLKLLDDPDIGVARAAAQSVGVLRLPGALPALMEQLARPPVRRATRTAITSYGPDVIDELLARLTDDTRELAVRIAIPKVIAELDHQKAVDALFDFLPATDHRLHYQAVRALARLQSRNLSLRFSPSEIESLIAHERRWLVELVRHSRTLASEKRPSETFALLRTVVDERIEFTRERLFLLLGIAYPREAMGDVFSRIAMGSPATRGVALEYLANVLTPADRAALVPLLETTDVESLRRQAGARTTPASSLREGIVELAHSSDDWLAACAITVLGELGVGRDAGRIEFLLQHHATVVVEAARRALGDDPPRATGNRENS